MTRLVNDPAGFAGAALAEFAAINADRVALVRGGVVRARRAPGGQVAIVMGGGSGHFPAFAGWVGRGLGHGAACGNVFASPSENEVLTVARAAEAGGGVLLVPINYAGDILNFGAAAQRLAADGTQARMVAVTDDIASAPADARSLRRGIAGSLLVIKMAGAAAERGASLDEAGRVAVAANDATRTFGVAFSGCTLPGGDGPLFTVPAGQMALGLGIHGEPGLSQVPLGTADEVADVLVDGLFAERSPRRGARVALLVNGLGATKYDELHIVCARARARLAAEGMTAVAPLAGEYVTSLDMAGVSVSLAYLDDELESLWLSPVDAPALTRFAAGPWPAAPAADATPPPGSTAAAAAGPGPVAAVAAGSPASARAARLAAAALERATARLAGQEASLGALDAVAGDGDHGAGMVRGARAATRAAAGAAGRGAGAGTTLRLAGEHWSDAAGGTSGALWGTGLAAAGASAGDDADLGREAVVAAVRAFADAIIARGGAAVGDKTMVDAIVPFADELGAAVARGLDLAAAWAAGAAAARSAAERTAQYVSARGRSRMHGGRSIGTPDPGAVSFALIAEAALPA
ncbi:MAG TPA: dihydroxyacetone kinase family protein [Trebonia sp.]|jgi:dihydroxyacetone kinase|nr:dihydroxyacetone kinase family protein [Trebonia sp.]